MSHHSNQFVYWHIRMYVVHVMWECVSAAPFQFSKKEANIQSANCEINETVTAATSSRKQQTNKRPSEWWNCVDFAYLIRTSICVLNKSNRHLILCSAYFDALLSLYLTHSLIRARLFSSIIIVRLGRFVIFLLFVYILADVHTTLTIF